MARLCRSFMQACWALGVLAMLGGVAVKLSHSLMDRVGTEPRGVLMFAGVLFLCAIATHAVEGTGVPAGK